MPPNRLNHMPEKPSSRWWRVVVDDYKVCIEAKVKIDQ